MLTCVNCGPDCDKETAKSPQTGDPFARMSRDLGDMRKLSNLQSDANLMCQYYQSQYTFNFFFKKVLSKPKTGFFTQNTQFDEYCRNSGPNSSLQNQLVR